MSAETHALILDLVEWVAIQPRPYADVMATWRTSCPRLTIGEDGVDRGYVVREHRDGAEAVVTATEAGRAFLAAEGRVPRAAVT